MRDKTGSRFSAHDLCLFMILVLLPLTAGLHVYEVFQEDFFFLTEDTVFYDFFSYSKEIVLAACDILAVLMIAGRCFIKGKRPVWDNAFGFWLAFLAVRGSWSGMDGRLSEL